MHGYCKCVLLDQGLVEWWGDNEIDQAYCGGMVDHVTQIVEDKNITDLDKVEYGNGLASNSRNRGNA